MQTFIRAKPLVDDPYYEGKKRKAIHDLQELLKTNAIDLPIMDLIKDFGTLPYCYTLQCCYGHFVHRFQPDKNNFDSLTEFKDLSSPIEYRIAYIAWCIQNNDEGKLLLKDLKVIAEIDPAFIQFGSAGWFWDQSVNSYVLQVEPERAKFEDTTTVTLEEGLHLEKIRKELFTALRTIVQNHKQI